MEEKKLFTEKEIKESLYSVYSKEFSLREARSCSVFFNDDYYRGFIDALISFYCYVFNTNDCPAYFGVDKENENEK